MSEGKEAAWDVLLTRPGGKNISVYLGILLTTHADLSQFEI